MRLLPLAFGLAVLRLGLAFLGGSESRKISSNAHTAPSVTSTDRHRFPQASG